MSNTTCIEDGRVAGTPIIFLHIDLLRTIFPGNIHLILKTPTGSAFGVCAS